MPLALKPDAKTAAVIGIGTGLTTHTLLQSLAIERVETVEIEAAMAEASRGFMPRNGATFLDPRSAILIDDAKTFFSSRNRRYDILISEPSNPWVSGVSSLFTREFYRRIRGHLNPGGVLVQWFQLYEIDASLLASVMRALGEEFPHYAVYAPSDHDVLIVAGMAPLPAAPDARVFEQPGVAKELWTVHVLSAGDLDARYLGSRATLEPLFASYGARANSDYYPVLDLNAARHRFMEKSATDVVALLNLGVPVLELLEPAFARRPMNPAAQGRLLLRAHRERAPGRLRARFPAAAAGAAARHPDAAAEGPRSGEAAPAGVPRRARVRRVAAQPAARGEARQPVAAAGRGGRPLVAHRRRALRSRTARVPAPVDRAVPGGGRARRAHHGAASRRCCSTPRRSCTAEGREYLLMAGMSGAIASGRHGLALELWERHAGNLAQGAGQPAFRLLRCHAQPGAGDACADALRAYAQD